MLLAKNTASLFGTKIAQANKQGGKKKEKESNTCRCKSPPKKTTPERVERCLHPRMIPSTQAKVQVAFKDSGEQTADQAKQGLGPTNANQEPQPNVTQAKVERNTKSNCLPAKRVTQGKKVCHALSGHALLGKGRGDGNQAQPLLDFAA